MKPLSIVDLSILNDIACAGGVVVIKVDGERLIAGESKIYTLMISGGKLAGDDFFRLDGDSILDLISAGSDYYLSNAVE